MCDTGGMHSTANAIGLRVRPTMDWPGPTVGRARPPSVACDWLTELTVTDQERPRRFYETHFGLYAGARRATTRWHADDEHIARVECGVFGEQPDASSHTRTQ